MGLDPEELIRVASASYALSSVVDQVMVADVCFKIWVLTQLQ